MTVELAHPSTEPLASRSPTTPAHPRWWFLWTTPGRILSIGIVLSALVIASAFATSTTINDRQRALAAQLERGPVVNRHDAIVDILEIAPEQRDDAVWAALVREVSRAQIIYHRLHDETLPAPKPTPRFTWPQHNGSWPMLLRSGAKRHFS